jgi:hypothetical protein
VNHSEDPVDSALDLLRSEQWTGENQNLQLEQKLMTAFHHQHAQRRFPRSRTTMAALAFIALGGVAFAATGGVSRLAGWFLNVQINGEDYQVELDESGQASFTLDTEDGAEAAVHIARGVGGSGEQMTTVNVVAGDDETEDEIVIARGQQMQALMDHRAYGLKDLGDAEPVSEWTDESGGWNELYIRPGEDGAGSRIFRAVTDQDGRTEVSLVAAATVDLLEGDVLPQVVMDADGLLTITRDDGDGEVEVMKLKIDHSAGESLEGLPGDMDLDTPAGNIVIELSTDAADN